MTHSTSIFFFLGDKLFFSFVFSKQKKKFHFGPIFLILPPTGRGANREKKWKKLSLRVTNPFWTSTDRNAKISDKSQERALNNCKIQGFFAILQFLTHEKKTPCDGEFGSWWPVFFFFTFEDGKNKIPQKKNSFLKLAGNSDELQANRLDDESVFALSEVLGEGGNSYACLGGFILIYATYTRTHTAQ